MRFQAAYVPIGVGTFHLESAQIEFEKSIKMISSLTDECVFPEQMLLSMDLLSSYLDGLDPDLIILQNITFANAAYATEVLRRFDCPVLLWTLREPVIDGGRLRLNSLTGAYSAANTLRAFRDTEFEYIFGSPEEEEVIAKVRSTLKAAKVKVQVKNLKICSIGHTPEGFGFGRALDADMTGNFGARLDAIEARELINRAKKYTDEECAEYMDKACGCMVGLENTPERNRKDFAKLYKSYLTYIKEKGYGAVSSRCWPDFFTDFGTPVCSVLSILNSLGIAAACEADTYGALSMYIGIELSGKSVFFGDPVSMDEGENTITFWHCGMASCNLARKDTGATVGVHPNRKIGPAMDFGCEASEKATIFRIGRLKNGKFRFFIAQGAILDKPKQFIGTSIVVQTKESAKNVVYGSVKDGWEPHFVVIYDDVAAELEALARMYNMEICSYV